MHHHGANILENLPMVPYILSKKVQDTYVNPWCLYPGKTTNGIFQLPKYASPWCVYSGKSFNSTFHTVEKILGYICMTLVLTSVKTFDTYLQYCRKNSKTHIQHLGDYIRENLPTVSSTLSKEFYHAYASHQCLYPGKSSTSTFHVVKKILAYICILFWLTSG